MTTNITTIPREKLSKKEESALITGKRVLNRIWQNLTLHAKIDPVSFLNLPDDFREIIATDLPSQAKDVQTRHRTLAREYEELETRYQKPLYQMLFDDEIYDKEDQLVTLKEEVEDAIYYEDEIETEADQGSDTDFLLNHSPTSKTPKDRLPVLTDSVRSKDDTECKEDQGVCAHNTMEPEFVQIKREMECCNTKLTQLRSQPQTETLENEIMSLQNNYNNLSYRYFSLMSKLSGNELEML